MKVLQLCHKPPLPKVDGGCIAINTISQGLLREGVELKILTASTHKHPFKKAEMPKDFVEKTAIEGVFLDTRINIIDAFSALVTADSYNVNRFFSPDFDRKLINLIKKNKYDVIHLESLFMTPYIDTIRKLDKKPKIVLRSHNLEHLIWERLANSTGNKAKRMYLKHLASKLKKYEKRTINEVDGIAAISKEDTLRFKEFDCQVPIITIPFGIELDQYEYKEKSGNNLNKIFHIGAMNWEPNKEGINWFIDSIWPKLENKDLEVHLAGRAMPGYLSDLNQENFIVHNEVADAKQFMADHDIMIVPLLSGSGIRIKIIEAMAAGKAVVSTTVGAEGISYTHGKDIIIADSAADIAKALIELSGNADKVRSLGKNARKLIEDQYDNNKIIKNLIQFYQS